MKNPVVTVSARATGKENDGVEASPVRGGSARKATQQEAPRPCEDEHCYSFKDSRTDAFARKARVSRESIRETLCNVRKLDAEVVKYRDRITGKMIDGRVPAVLLAM